MTSICYDVNVSGHHEAGCMQDVKLERITGVALASQSPPSFVPTGAIHGRRKTIGICVECYHAQ